MNQPVHLYLDENIHNRLILPLRSRGYDVTTTIEAGNKGISDIKQLEYAVQNQTTLFTFNISDFTNLHKTWIDRGRTHYGILLSQQLEIKEIIRRILIFLSKTRSEEIYNQLLYLSQWK